MSVELIAVVYSPAKRAITQMVVPATTAPKMTGDEKCVMVSRAFFHGFRTMKDFMSAIPPLASFNDPR